MRNRGCSLPPSATEWTATGGPRGKGWDGWGSRAHCALWKIRGELTPRPDTWLGQLTRRQQRILLTTALYAHVGLGTEILLRAAGVRDDGAVVSALRPRIHTPEPIVEKVARQHRIQRLRRHAMPGGSHRTQPVQLHSKCGNLQGLVSRGEFRTRRSRHVPRALGGRSRRRASWMRRTRRYWPAPTRDIRAREVSRGAV